MHLYGCKLHQILVKLILIAVSSKTLVESANDARARPPINRLLLVTVANNPSSESFQRFNRSVASFELELSVLSSKDVEQDLDDRQRVELIRKALNNHKNDEDLLIMLLDNDNIVVNGHKRDVLARFDKFKPKTRIVIAADDTCWPDASLESKYSKPSSVGLNFLNSGALIGYAPKLWDLFSLLEPQTGESSLQSALTKVYLNGEIRDRLAIELDRRAELFQRLPVNETDVELIIDSNHNKLKNLLYSTEPLVVQGRKSSDTLLNSLSNYLGNAWTAQSGCRDCNFIEASNAKESALVLLGIFIEEPTPFLDDFFFTLRKLNYPTNRIHLLIHNSVEYHSEEVNKFLRDFGPKYASQQVVESTKPEWEARNLALERCRVLNCDFYLSLDSVARIELPDTLKILIRANKTLIAPMLSRPKKLWSNFWAALSADDFYSRSHDYIELVKGERTGIWLVPHVMNAYLMSGGFIASCLNDTSKRSKLSYKSDEWNHLKPVLSFTRHLRELRVFQHLLNTEQFGHLVDPSSYDTNVTHPDFHQLSDNMIDWERKYLHENYSLMLEEETRIEQPCPDVFWFPLVNDLFCDQLVQIMENFGQWSSGTSHDPRIEGGYESVPTRDIHMRQVELHEMWLTFLHEYVMPVQLRQFIGYEHEPPRADLAFVVRYNPVEQASLKPHHDSSTYTLNIALNEPGKDYEGGGCRFVRYDCNVTQSRKGWALIHPGRLTHYHEGLQVVSGTRYIMVTFIDP